MGKQFAVLECAREAEARALVGFASGDILMAKADAARPAIDAVDAVEHAGLAGPVRPDKGEQLARRHGKRHVVENGEAAEAQRQTLDREFSHTISGCGDTA